ncbi:tail fiber domain-containing protein [Rubrivivax sp. JA1024]|nr:tail fiber domain-containing protein [Rubrivivax sp. JA1024]
MDTPEPPAAPDPVKTAEAQGQINQNTAVSQQLLNMVDQVTPTGSLTYSQNGTTSFVGADGKTYTVPRFTATQTLTPEQQQLLELSNKTQANLGQIGVDQSAKIGSLLGTNLKLGNEATEARLMELGSARLDPKFARDEDALRTRLANQGIQPGSAAWNAEMTQFGQGKNDAYNQLLLNGRQLANTEMQAERNAPINEITALLSGSQVSSPNYTSTPTTGVAGTDYAGMVSNNYGQQMQAYNAQLQSNNAAMGGMFGLAGTLGAAGMKYGPGLMAMSDRRLKSDIVDTGETFAGLPVYEYTIFGRRERGVMADEVEQVMPEAVALHPSGFQMVDYGKLQELV